MFNYLRVAAASFLLIGGASQSFAVGLSSTPTDLNLQLQVPDEFDAHFQLDRFLSARTTADARAFEWDNRQKLWLKSTILAPEFQGYGGGLSFRSTSIKTSGTRQDVLDMFGNNVKSFYETRVLCEQCNDNDSVEPGYRVTARYGRRVSGATTPIYLGWGYGYEGSGAPLDFKPTAFIEVLLR